VAVPGRETFDVGLGGHGGGGEGDVSGAVHIGFGCAAARRPAGPQRRPAERRSED
jgi:hypothetical protein